MMLNRWPQTLRNLILKQKMDNILEQMLYSLKGMDNDRCAHTHIHTHTHKYTHTQSASDKKNMSIKTKYNIQISARTKFRLRNSSR